MIQLLKQGYHNYKIAELRKSPFLWMYAAYITLRYVDNYKNFPAIKFNSYVKVLIKKCEGSLFNINERLVVEPFNTKKGLPISITLNNNSKLIIEGEFVLGDGIRILVNNEAVFLVKGKLFESASGITTNSIILVDKYLEIGKDCIIAWDTFLTDCDWHSIDGKNSSYDTIIGDHVWIGVGAKVLKGAVVGKNSIVTSNTVVLRGNYAEQALLSGNPARVVKTEIPMWRRDLK